MTEAMDLQRKQVLVTGGLGFIGSNLAHACLRLGAEVTVFDSLDPRCGGNPANLGGIEKDVRVIRGDIRSAEAVAQTVGSSDLLFNCAALTSHPGSMVDPRAYIDVNCDGVVTLLEAARKAGTPPRFVQIGTSTQVGRMISEPVTEDHPEFPLDVYSVTKTMAEKLVLLYGTAYDLPVTAIRLANVYGPRAKLTDPGLSFVNYFVGLALRGEDLTVYGPGLQRRAVTYVDDVVEALIQASLSEACVGEALFAAAQRHHTVREIAEAIVRVFGRGRVRLVEWPADRRSTEVGDVIISSDRIAGLVGWRARTDLDDGLARTARFYDARLAQYVS